MGGDQCNSHRTLVCKTLKLKLYRMKHERSGEGKMKMEQEHLLKYQDLGMRLVRGQGWVIETSIQFCVLIIHLVIRMSSGLIISFQHWLSFKIIGASFTQVQVFLSSFSLSSSCLSLRWGQIGRTDNFHSIQIHYLLGLHFQ